MCVQPIILAPWADMGDYNADMGDCQHCDLRLFVLLCVYNQ